jgi:hypothetical protein
LIEIKGYGCFAKPSLGNFMATFMNNYHLPLKVFFSHHLLSWILSFCYHLWRLPLKVA